MKNLTVVFIILSFFVFSNSISVRTVYSDVADKDVGVSSEEITSIRNFEKQTKKSIEDASLLIRNKEFEKAKKELGNALVLVRAKISVYENKAETLVSEKRENSAKFYYQEASVLGGMAVQISKSLEEITRLEIDNNIKLSKEYISKNNFTEAQILLDKTLKLLPDKERNQRKTIESLLSSISNLKEKYENKKLQGRSIDYTTKGFEYLQTDKLDEAETSFNEALKIASDNRKAKDGLVQVERARSRFKAQRVSELLEQARGNILAEVFDLAEKQLREVLKLEPDNRRAQSYMEDIARGRQAKEYRDLMSNVDRKIEEGKNHLSLGEFGKANIVLKKALALLSPDEKRRSGEINTLLASIPQSEQKYQAKAKSDRIEDIVAFAKQQLEENKLRELIKEGRDDFANNNFEEAKKKFLAALKIRPKNELVLRYLDETEQAKKEYEGSQAVEKIIAEGKKYLEAEQLNEAEAVFGKASRMSLSESKQLQIQSLLSDVEARKQIIQDRNLRRRADEFINKGIDNVNKEQYAQAKVNFERALSVKPDYSEAKEWLIRLETIQKEAGRQKLQGMLEEAREYLNNNQFDRAEANIKEVLKINPNHHEALRYLNTLDKAKEEYKSGQQFEKIKAKIVLGMKFLEEEQFAKAESVFKEAVDMSPVYMKQQTIAAVENNVNSFIQEIETQRQVDKYISSGVTYLGNNELDKAEDAFNCAIRLAPGHKDVKQYLQELEIARLKNKNIQLLEQVGGSIGESRELKQNNLEEDINRLIGQIKVKIGE